MSRGFLGRRFDRHEVPKWATAHSSCPADERMSGAAPVVDLARDVRKQGAYQPGMSAPVRSIQDYASRPWAVAGSTVLRGRNLQAPRGGPSIACLDVELRRDYNVITQWRSASHEG